MTRFRYGVLPMLRYDMLCYALQWLVQYFATQSQREPSDIVIEDVAVTTAGSRLLTASGSRQALGLTSPNAVFSVEILANGLPILSSSVRYFVCIVVCKILWFSCLHLLGYDAMLS